MIKANGGGSQVTSLLPKWRNHVMSHLSVYQVLMGAFSFSNRNFMASVKNIPLLVWDLSLVITVCHSRQSIVMSNGNPTVGDFYPALTFMIDAYILTYRTCKTGQVVSLLNPGEPYPTWRVFITHSACLSDITRTYAAWLYMRGLGPDVVFVVGPTEV